MRLVSRLIMDHWGSLKRFGVALCAIVFLVTGYSPTVFAMTPADQSSIENSTPFYNPTANCATANGFTGISINNAAAEQVAKAASTGTTNVGYALYSADGTLQANYNDTFETYGASITKAMLLVAYLNEQGAAPLSSTAVTDLTGMIEDSNDTDANNVYNMLTIPTQELNAVAQTAGMTGFKLNTTGDSLYYLGQSQITANDFAKFFSKIDTMFPPSEKTFALTLLSNISPYTGLLQAGLPGTVYSKEGWKPEPGGGSDPARSGSANPFGNEGAPWIVNQAAQFVSNGITYGVAVTVSGTATQASGEAIIKNVVTALVSTGGSSTTETCTCTSGSVALTGSDNEQKTWNYLKSLGLSDAQTAGVMGNFEQESGFDPERIQNGGDSQDPTTADPGGWGLAQWTPGSSVLEAASANTISGPIYELATQLSLVAAQMNGTSPNGTQDMIKALKQDTDPATAALDFDAMFEGGTDPNGVRESDAKTILQMYQGTGDSGESTASCATGSPDCNTAAGDTKILCEALQYNPASYSESAAGDHYPITGSPPPAPGKGGNLTWLPSCPTINASCYLDCSGLVNISVYDAFGYNLSENTYGEVADESANPPLWKQVPFSQIQPGDLIQPAEYAGGHVEIIDHVDGTTIYTFGAHDPNPPQADQVGPASYQASPGDVYLQWVGPT